jgi:hypothetical protein
MAYIINQVIDLFCIYWLSKYLYKLELFFIKLFFIINILIIILFIIKK